MQFSGNWYDFTASYTATAVDAGDPIEIILSSLTGNATPIGWFADVRLTDSLSTGTTVAGAPEPSTWAMLLVGFGFMGWLGYRPATGRGARESLLPK